MIIEIDDLYDRTENERKYKNVASKINYWKKHAHKREVFRKYREKNKDRINEEQRKYREDNKAAMLAYEREYYTKNIDKRRRQKRERLKHPDRVGPVKEWRKQYRENNLEMVRRRERIYSLLRRADGVLAPAKWQRLVDEFGGRCAYCGDIAPLEADHVVPIVLGGPTKIENLLPACVPCNRSKGPKPLEDWNPSAYEKYKARIDLVEVRDVQTAGQPTSECCAVAVDG